MQNYDFIYFFLFQNYFFIKFYVLLVIGIVYDLIYFIYFVFYEKYNIKLLEVGMCFLEKKVVCLIVVFEVISWDVQVSYVIL